MPESPLFARSYDLLRWLIPIAIAFPRSHRFVLAERIQRQALDLHETLIAAAKAAAPGPDLRRADLALERLRFELRLAHDLGLRFHGQYRRAAKLLAEIGWLLGAWIKKDNAGRRSIPEKLPARAGPYASRWCRGAYRNRNNPNNWNNNQGFRVVRVSPGHSES